MWSLSSRQTYTGSPELEEEEAAAHVRMNILRPLSVVKAAVCASMMKRQYDRDARARG